MGMPRREAFPEKQITLRTSRRPVRCSLSPKKLHSRPQTRSFTDKLIVGPMPKVYRIAANFRADSRISLDKLAGVDRRVSHECIMDLIVSILYTCAISSGRLTPLLITVIKIYRAPPSSVPPPSAAYRTAMGWGKLWRRWWGYRARYPA